MLCGAAQRVAGLLDADAAARWERLELDQSLARMPDVVHCPRCSTPCIEDGGDHCAQCPKCLFAFCALCNDSWHGRSVQARAHQVSVCVFFQTALRHAGRERGVVFCMQCIRRLFALCLLLQLCKDSWYDHSLLACSVLASSMYSDLQGAAAAVCGCRAHLLHVHMWYAVAT